ncbi:hypothetical protein IV417_13870 [Alphaproteobacteria bacterium KMM 3653]|uniref:2'-5' RNA ligase n=1 Tax=Harenicola maris TaxID=2841044 RepID=A0AAP2CVL5_9RHOB|nr:hypothetical protein [Harenicola maris]
MNDVTEPHSVWLMPQSDVAAQLSALNAELSAAGAGPVFAPHLTLLGDLEGAPEASAAICADLFSGSGVIEGRINAVRTGPAYFMALYAEVPLPEGRLAARAALIQRLERPAAQGFTPHISLAYGPDAPAMRHRFEGALEGLVGMRVVFDHLAIARSAKSIPERDWQVLQKIYL